MHLVCWHHACTEVDGFDSSTHHQPQERMQYAWKTQDLYNLSRFETRETTNMMETINDENQMQIWENSNLKKFIILIFESASISGLESNAFCMWCNHLSAAWCVTGNGRWRAMSAGWPANYKSEKKKIINLFFFR